MSAVLEVEPIGHSLRTDDEDRRFVVHANWSKYLQFLQARGANYRELRLTFDRGRLEFMSISSKHDTCRYLLGRIVDTVTEELNIAVVGQGETTIRREDLDRGFEPDAWYYIENADQMQGIDRELNFEIDPAPDLAIEIEISRSLLDRIGLYAAVGVREIWQFDGSIVRFLELQPEGEYEEVSISRAIPALSAVEVNRILNEAGRESTTSYFRGLRVWIRDHLVQTGK